MVLVDMGLFRLPLALILIAPSVISSAYAAEAKTTLKALTETAENVSDPARVTLIAITKSGNRLVATGEHGVIIVSVDNGKIWRQASVPVSGTITAVAFATPLQGWSAGDYGIILHTKDGGLTWQTQLNGDQVNQMTLASAQKFDSQNHGSQAGAMAIRRANIFMQAGPDKPFLSVLALSKKKVFVFGAYRMAVVTNDGGNKWHEISSSVADPLSHNIYDAITSGKNIYLAEETGLVFRSTDNGQTFSQVAPSMGVTLFGVLAAANGNLLAYGVAGALFLSTDEGAQWTQINLKISTNLTAARLICNNELMVASQAGDVFISQDNGLTFHAAAASLGMAVYDFVQSENGNIVFVGSGGVREVSRSTISNP